MTREKKNVGRKARSLAGALLLGLASISRGEDFIYGPVTNNLTLIPIESTEYLVNASSSYGGIVSGTTNNWAEAGYTGSVTALANNHYKFVGWQGLPSGSDTNNPIFNFVLNSPLEIYANFVPKEIKFEDVGFSSVRPKGNKIDLTIPNTYTNSTYHVYGNTNLLFNSWTEETNKIGNGEDLIFNLNMDADRKFYRSSRSWEE